MVKALILSEPVIIGTYFVSNLGGEERLVIANV